MRKIRRVCMTLALAGLLAGMTACGNNTTNDAGGQSWEKTRKTHVLTIDPARRNRWFVVGNTYNDLSYFNDGININVADRPSLSACDMNHHGIMDIVAFETSGRTYNEEPFIDNISREGIFLGNGDGTFEQYKPAFVDAKGNPVEFDMRYILSGDVADFNNDGTLDLVAGLNTSPDLGVGSRQCLVTAYPLDVSQMNPNAPADLSDFEVTPNY